MYVMLCYVMLCYVMLCYVMLCYVMLCYVMLLRPINCNILHNVKQYTRKGSRHCVSQSKDLYPKLISISECLTRVVFNLSQELELSHTFMSFI